MCKSLTAEEEVIIILCEYFHVALCTRKDMLPGWCYVVPVSRKEDETIIDSFGKRRTYNGILQSGT